MKVQLTIREGCFNMLDASDKSTIVNIKLDDEKACSIHLDGSRKDDLEELDWDELLTEACDICIEETWVSSELKRVKELRERLTEADFVEDLLQAQAKRDLPRLRAKILSMKDKVSEMETWLDKSWA